ELVYAGRDTKCQGTYRFELKYLNTLKWTLEKNDWNLEELFFNAVVPNRDSYNSLSSSEFDLDNDAEFKSLCQKWEKPEDVVKAKLMLKKSNAKFSFLYSFDDSGHLKPDMS